VTALGVVMLGASAWGDTRDWSFAQDTAREIAVPEAVVQAADFGVLEYDAPPYRGLRADLDGDGVSEYIVQSAPSLCGNGGCVYALFDGSSLRSLGMIFGGSMVVRAAPVGEFPVINALSHLSAEAATYTTFAYRGGGYVRLTSIEVSGPALDQLVRELRRVPPR